MLKRKDSKLFKVVNENGKTIDTTTPCIVQSRREVVQAFLPPGLRGLRITTEKDLKEQRATANDFDIDSEIERSKKEML